MRCGIAVWNYVEPDVPLLDLIGEFADYGYNALSFLPGQLAALDRAQWRDVSSVVRDRHLLVTIHGNFDMPLGDAERALGWLGDALYAISLDSAMVWESRGGLYDAKRMAGLVRGVIGMSAGTRLRVAIEDFPLDAPALDFYRADLAPVLACPRYGILIDIGHLSLRLRGGGYFQGVSPAEYMRRLPLPVVEIHVHDNRGERDDHGHLGFGNIGFQEVAEALSAIGFCGVSTIEIAPSFHGSTPAESKPHARHSLQQWRAIWRRCDDRAQRPSPTGR